MCITTFLCGFELVQLVVQSLSKNQICNTQQSYLELLV